MKNMLLATSTLTALALAMPAWSQAQPTPSPGGIVGPDMLCSEIIEGGPEVAREAASFFTASQSGIQAASAGSGPAPSQSEQTQQPGAQPTTPEAGGDPTQEAHQTAGPTPTEPQGSNASNAGGSSAESATDAAPPNDGTIVTGAGNFASNDNSAQAGSDNMGGGTAPEPEVAQLSLTAEQLLATCQSSPSERVASMITQQDEVPAGATSSSGTNSLQSSGGAPGANDTGTTSGTAGAPAAPTAPIEGAAPVETD
jgi:hypothetical protein